MLNVTGVSSTVVAKSFEAEGGIAIVFAFVKTISSKGARLSAMVRESDAQPFTEAKAGAWHKIVIKPETRQ
jgi:hypothetical protein